MINKRLFLISIFTLALFATAYAGGKKGDPEVLYKYRLNAGFQFEVAKDLKLSIEPEVRFNEGLDLFLINGGVSYKTFGCIYWGATYRLDLDYNKDELELFHRYAFDVTYKDKFGSFTPSIRLRYNNFADEDIDSKEYLRYRAKVEYDIPKCKITPFVAAEAYQEMSGNQLYKMRYATGFDLKVSKKSALSFDYKFDMFMQKYKNANIFSVGYKYKF